MRYPALQRSSSARLLLSRSFRARLPYSTMSTFEKNVNRVFGHNNPTTYEDWKLSDDYHNARLIKPDDTLTGAQIRAQDGGLPPISVSAAQGKYLHLLAKSIGAKKVVEVGTLGGYVDTGLISFSV